MHRVPDHSASGRCPREWLPAVILALLLASTAAADVTIKEKSVSEGLGGFGNTTTSRTLIVAGDRSRAEDEATYTGRFKTLAGGGKPQATVSITRLDKEVVWSLDPAKKTYTEMTFAEMRALMESGLAEADKASREAEAKDEEMTFTVDVKRTGAKQDVNGFPAEQVVITCVGKPKNTGKDEAAAGFRMVMDQWLAKGTPGAQEMTAYYRRFAEKMGLEMEMANISGMARRMYGNAMKELAAKLKDLGGFPVRSTFTIEGSPETAEKQRQAAARAEEGKASAAAERAQAKEEAASAERQQDKQDAGDLGAAAASGGDVKSKIGGFLGRKLAGAAQKKTEEKVEKKAGEMSSPGTAGGPLLKVVTDVISITTSPAPAGSFDVPAGYKLQKRD